MCKLLSMVAAAAATTLAGAAAADFFPEQPVAINGTAGPEFGGTAWGTNQGQGDHLLGGFNTYTDIFFPAFTVEVSSSFVGENVLSIFINFSDFSPGDFTTHLVEIIGLKQDGTIIGVTASQGTVGTDGNNVSWSGLGDDLALEPDVKITIEQVPAPGAIALLCLAGFVIRRRRA